MHKPALVGCWALLAFLALGVASLWSPSVLAASPVQAHQFADADQGRRYQQLIAEFRCPKCLNTNLKGSDSPIAVDLRRAVARLIRDGRTDAQIRDYLQERYGDFVLYDPPFKPATYILWLGPLGLLGAALLVLWRTVAAARIQPEPALDTQQLADVLAELESGVDPVLEAAAPTADKPVS